MGPGLPPRILVVDDDLFVLATLSSILEENGFPCRTARNGLEALKELCLTLPDVIVSDLRMPIMSGFELLPILRDRYPQIRVIVVSAESADGVRTMGLPMDAYFEKGAFKLAQLIAAIRSLDTSMYRGLRSGPHMERPSEEAV